MGGDAQAGYVGCSAQGKSKPRNDAGEIFITAAAEITRETVYAANLTERETKKPRQFAPRLFRRHHHRQVL